MPATPLLLISGLACTDTLFAAQTPVLAQDRQVIIGDHMQHDSMSDIAAHILVGAPERFALAGLSMGGYLCFEIMRQAPERVERLALLDTSARPDTPEKTALRVEALELVAAGKFMAVCHATLDLSIAKSRHDDTVLKQAIIDMAVDTGPDVWAQQIHAIMGRAESVPMLEKITCPTLVVVGEEDQLTPPDLAQEMVAGIPDARLEVIPDCGHMSTMEKPDQLTVLLQDWLAG
ncbi:alpha/beta fold hydrolase [Profundibacter sp.]|uniref:alpha/beta fold hydrolase n=1 Tax=Profundibacter sp. TaxID=3101071 RepID=UPI003D0EA699